MKSTNQQLSKEISQKKEKTYDFSQKEIEQIRVAFNNQSIDNQELNRLIKQHQSQIKVNLNLSKSHDELLKNMTLFKHIRKCQAAQLKIILPSKQNKNQKRQSKQLVQFFLKGISHICFQSLKELNLGYNNISNIQSITYLINSPNLEKMILNQNKIYCLKSLARTNLNHLYTIDIEDNPILQINPMTKMKISYEQFFDVKISSGQLYDIFWVTVGIKFQNKFLMKFQSNQQKEQMVKLVQQQNQPHILKIAKMSMKRYYQSKLELNQINIFDS